MRISRSFFLAPVFMLCLPLSSWAQTTCSSGVSDTDGDGWGWENNQTCRVVAASSSATGVPVFPVCSNSQSDTNGDGFGWENNATCQVSSNSGSSAVPSAAAALAAFPVCSSSQADPNLAALQPAQPASRILMVTDGPLKTVVVVAYQVIRKRHQQRRRSCRMVLHPLACALETRHSDG